MTIETNLKSALDDHSGLAALVVDRSYPVRLPQNPTYPCLVYSRTETDFQNTMTGNNDRTNLTLQIDCFDDSYNGVRAVARQVLDAMDSTLLFNALPLNDVDLAFEFDLEIYQVVLTFSVWFKN